MSHYRSGRRRLLRGISNLCILAVIPVGAAVIVRELPDIRSAADRFGSLQLDKNTAETAASRQRIEESDAAAADILPGGYMLSEGFGYEEETAPLRGIYGLQSLMSPLDMVSEFPGDKPYPTQWSAGGDIIRTTYGEYFGTAFFSLDTCGQVNNKTELSNSYLLEESRNPPDFNVTDTNEPQVLIYHTHTTESFEPFVRDSYDDTFNYRTTDETKNIVMVGDAIQAELEAMGIGVSHAREIHDYPSYNGSYARSRETILPILEEYPSIKVALDIHRDAISGEGFAYQPYVELDGREAAQVMIISGCDDGTLDMPDYIKNFHFACALQQQLEGDFPGLTRPILFDYRHYNQDLTTGSLLIEVGSHGNTLEQVQYSGQLIGRSLGELLNDMKEQ